MERSIIAKLTDIVSLIVPSGVELSVGMATERIQQYLDTESGTVFPLNFFCSSGMVCTERTCRSERLAKVYYTRLLGITEDYKGLLRQGDTHSTGILDLIFRWLSALQQL